MQNASGKCNGREPPREGASGRPAPPKKPRHTGTQAPQRRSARHRAVPSQAFLLKARRRASRRNVPAAGVGPPRIMRRRRVCKRVRLRHRRSPRPGSHHRDAADRAHRRSERQACRRPVVGLEGLGAAVVVRLAAGCAPSWVCVAVSSGCQNRCQFPPRDAVEAPFLWAGRRGRGTVFASQAGQRRRDARASLRHATTAVVHPTGS